MSIEEHPEKQTLTASDIPNNVFEFHDATGGAPTDAERAEADRDRARIRDSYTNSDTTDLIYPDGSQAKSDYQPRVTLDNNSEQQKVGWWTRKKVAAAIAIGAVTGVGVGAGVYAANQSSHVSADKGKDASDKGLGAEQGLSANEKKFVETYGSRYSNPLAVYNAEVALETTGTYKGQNFMLDDKYLDTFNPNASINGVVGPLGFTYNYLPTNAPIANDSAETSVKLFNSDSVQNCLNRYLNYKAKNPGDKAATMIEANFMRYCSFGPDDVQKGQNLISVLNQVVEKYGAAANYTVAPASVSENDTSATHFGNLTNIQYVDPETQIPQAFTNTVGLTINVETFAKDGKKVDTSTTIDNLQFEFSRVPSPKPGDYTLVDIGLTQVNQ